MIGTIRLRKSLLDFQIRQRWIVGDDKLIGFLCHLKTPTQQDDDPPPLYLSSSTRNVPHSVAHRWYHTMSSRKSSVAWTSKQQKDELSIALVSSRRGYASSLQRTNSNESFKNLDTMMIQSKSTDARSSSTDHSSSNNINVNKLMDTPPASSSATLRSRIRYQASCYRDSAVEKYHEFRESPGATAKAGAKSFGEMIKMYGPVFVGVYGTVYFSTLMTLWAGVESGILDPVSLFSWIGQGNDASTKASTVQLVLDFMSHHTMTKPYIHFVEENPSVANLAVAWIAVKFTEPFRLAVALSITPRVARYFGYGPKKIDDDNDDENDKTKHIDDTARSSNASKMSIDKDP
jgi:Protein of unknown function (DUF1279)